MAIDDIVGRIRTDAEAEAAALVAAASEDAERTASDARARAAAEAARTLARERARAQRDAETLLANARLRARDERLTARLAFDLEALASAEALMLALPDAEYAALLAAGVAASAAGTETILIAAADEARLRAALPAALAAAGVDGVGIGGAADGLEHGIVLAGERTRVEISPSAMLAGRRGELIALADRVLFGEEEAG